MELQNETALQAHLFSGPAGDVELGCALIVKGTWDIGPDGLRPAAQAPWPIHLEPLATPWGTFPAECPNRKPRVDLIVLGHARAPGPAPVASRSVSVSLGGFRHELVVFGDRRWESGALGIRATEPLPFHEKPITWANAYGGTVTNEFGELPWADNPEGKGIVFEGDDADGIALPNVEDPRGLVRSPDDHPRVAGWGPYPSRGGLRLANVLDAAGHLRPAAEVEPLLANWAHPDLMLGPVEAGETLTVTGVTERDAVVAQVPQCPFRATLRSGPEERELSPRLDTLIVETDTMRLVVRWRAAATLALRPREKRTVVVRPAAG